ncbi:MAG: hypothetical protein NVSMB26_00150 [Beijerinckiaceae bacterium]
MIEAGKQIVRAVSPELMSFISTMRSSLRARHYVRKTFWVRQSKAARLLYQERDIRILSGPFEGMRYINEVGWGPIEPKWIGTYEDELHEIMGVVIQTGYEVMIDVGAAEGYYACGMAYRCPDSHVWSFELDPWSRAQQKRIASLNNLENLNVGTLCTWEKLEQLAKRRTFLLCDIEGAEFDLLNPQACPAFALCDILVEVHRHGNQTTNEGAAVLANRFKDTHSLVRIDAVRKAAHRAPTSVLPPLSPEAIAEYLDEHRTPGQIWVWMRSKATRS